MEIATMHNQNTWLTVHPGPSAEITTAAALVVVCVAQGIGRQNLADVHRITVKTL